MQGSIKLKEASSPSSGLFSRTLRLSISISIKCLALVSGSDRFGPFRKFSCPGSMRFGLCFLDASWLYPVRFVSFPRPVPAGSRIKRFGSVRPVLFGFLLLPDSVLV